MKKKTARKKVTHSNHSKISSKKHTCFLNYCVCKHPSFIVSLVLLIIVSFGAVYLMLAK